MVITRTKVNIPEFTKQELQTAMGCLTKGKAGDTKGIKVGDIKECDDETKEMMEEIFSEVIRQENMAPEAWRKVVIRSESQKKRRGET